MDSFLESKYKKIKKSKEEAKKQERLKDARLGSQKVEHELLRLLKTLSGNKEEEISDVEKQAEVFFKKALKEFYRGARYLR